MYVFFLPSGKKSEYTGGESVLSIAARSGIDLGASCGGIKKCGKCKIRILDNTDTGGQTCCNELTNEEKQFLSTYEIQNSYRLACCVYPSGNLEIVVPESTGHTDRKKVLTHFPNHFRFEPAVRSQGIRLKPAGFNNQDSYSLRLSQALGLPSLRIPCPLLKTLHKTYTVNQGQLTAFYHEPDHSLIALEGKNRENECYGAAFDIGTTTVVGYLWNLKTHEFLHAASRTNYQVIHGGDVISRIQYAIANPEHVGIMQEFIIACINDIIEEMTAPYHIPAKSIMFVAAAGNTTMSHLFLGISPKPLSKIPFTPVLTSGQTITACHLHLHVNPLGKVYVLPNIAGHVGADITGMCLATEIDSLSGNHIALDIGTNGEIVARNDQVILTCSTAAGPAFEGSSIYQGMRAAPGAIEQVTVTDNILSIKTIDDIPPIGICGSGLIDAVSCLLTHGVIDSHGRMLSREEAKRKGVPDTLAARLIDYEQGTAFLLSGSEDPHPVILTAQDIREVQLAKGAICAGIRTLMDMLNVKNSDIDSLLLAGAFGNYINKESALNIGLLPEISPDKIVSCGNAAGTGVCMTLLSAKEQLHGEVLARKIKHVELSANEDFQNHYLESMLFP